MGANAAPQSSTYVPTPQGGLGGWNCPSIAENGELAETGLLVHPTPPIQKPNAAIWYTRSLWKISKNRPAEACQCRWSIWC